MAAQAGGSSPAATASRPEGSLKDRRLRLRAVPIFILLIAEILVGNELALAGSPYPVSFLAAHIVIALLLIGVTAHAFRISIQLPKASARVAAGLTFLASFGATLSGTLFLLAGGSNAALNGMEAFGLIALLGDILLLVWGSVTVQAPTTPISPS